MRSSQASQLPATASPLIPFNPIKHLEVVSIGTLGPQAPLSFHKSLFRLKTTIKNTSEQKQPLWNIQSGFFWYLNHAVEPRLKMGLIQYVWRGEDEGDPVGKEEQEVLALSFISSCLDPPSEVWNPLRACQPPNAALSSHTGSQQPPQRNKRHKGSLFIPVVLMTSWLVQARAGRFGPKIFPA